MNHCSRCKKDKPTQDFYFSGGRVSRYCKLCEKEYNQTPEMKRKASEYGKKYHKRPEVKERTKRIFRVWLKTVKGQEYIRRNGRNSQIKLRLQVIQKLGGKCVECGFSDVRALQIDHLEGNGSKLNRSQNWWSRYKEILAGTHKIKVQLLCANCNWIKRYENKETRHFMP